MTVYVDDMRAPFGRLVMCHMIADTDGELLEMADRIGVQRRWHQYAGSCRSHFDIAQTKRALALAAGAQPITWRETAAVTRHRRAVAAGHAEPLSIAAILGRASSVGRAPMTPCFPAVVRQADSTEHAQRPAGDLDHGQHKKKTPDERY